ncbi:MAG: CDP-diacylglycerol--glycerol-3-phosphate 3-phosphatidyltransferase [Lachnospiraceae bacterium]|jgi:CDP-diacylglycerol--glycerol-3-phosphate 3-phosphatidyltransferase|nr:CDP-diacylglycerol--glycerol-3-phosphate 3-phosphatidyltransferase [Lachnospiraceae bacterium]
MNLPNKLTILRILMIPFFVAFLLWQGGALYVCRVAAAGIFAVACLTDTLDGWIARKYGLVTNFGKFMDPLADKLLVCAALVGLVSLGLAPAWVVIVIISREFVISGFRLVASDKGVVIAAGVWGKLKTVFQMAAVILLVLPMGISQIAGQICLWVALALTIISLVEYIWKNRDVLAEG